MATQLQPSLTLKLYQTYAAVLLATRAPGSYYQNLTAEGNSLLSTLFVESLDVGASVTVTYTDTTVGNEVDDIFFLAAHTPVTTAVTSDRILVTRLHNKPIANITVAGGNARFGIYVTVVASFASDLDSALKKDGTIANLLSDKGLLAMGYDAIQGKYYFLPMEGGSVKVTGSFEATTGDPKIIDFGTSVSTPGSVQDFSTLVPVGKTWKLRAGSVVCRAHASFDILVAGIRVGTGKTNPAKPTVPFSFTPFVQANATEEVKISFLETSGPVTDVDALIQYTEV